MGIERDIDNLIKLIASVAEAFTAALFLPAERGSSLNLAACHSLSPHIQHDCSIEVGSGLIGWVAANGEPITVSDFKPETTTLGFYRSDEEIKSFLAVPVPLGDRRGVLSIDSKRSYVFPPRMQKLMTLFADHVGSLVHNSAVQSMLLQTTSAIDQLNSACGHLAAARSPAALVEAALACPPELVGAEGIGLALAEEGGESCRVVGTAGEAMPRCRDLVVSPKQSLAGWVLRNGKTLALADCREYYAKTFAFSPEEPYFGVRAFLGVPLLTGSEVFGVLAFIARRPGAFGSAEASTARLLATQVSTALRSAALAQRDRETRYRDHVTGLPNARSLSRHGGAFAERAMDEGQPLACLVVAVENLDEVRLSAGRRPAEEALRWLSRHCRSLVGEKNYVGRDQEGRLVLLCLRLNTARAQSLADKLLEGINQMDFADTEVPFSLKVSIGLAIFPDEAANLDALLARASLNAASARAGGGSLEHVAVEEGLHGAL
jgi:diguanylate cyclase (GGDEF)-like protein